MIRTWGLTHEIISCAEPKKTKKIPWTMTYLKYQTPSNQACPKFQSTCSTFGTLKFQIPNKHISTTSLNVKKSSWLLQGNANTGICIDSDKDYCEKNTNVCTTSAEPEFALKHEGFKEFPWEYSHLPRKFFIHIPCFNSYFHFHIQA